MLAVFQPQSTELTKSSVSYLAGLNHGGQPPMRKYTSAKSCRIPFLGLMLYRVHFKDQKAILRDSVAPLTHYTHIPKAKGHQHTKAQQLNGLRAANPNHEIIRPADSLRISNPTSDGHQDY